MAEAFDVIVAGGGFTGVAAAVAAAREGVSVLLVERYGFLGGAATNSYVNPFMCYAVKDENGQRAIVNAGLFTEILQRLDELGALHTDKATFNDVVLKLVLDRMATEHGVRVLFHSYVTDVKTEGSALKSVTVANKSGLTELSARCFIDCTGDADIAALAGCSFHIGREEDHQCQPMTLCFRVGNVDTETFWKNRNEANAKYQELRKAGKIRNHREDLLLFNQVANNVIHFNSTRIIKRSGVDAWDLSQAEMEAREQMLDLFLFMKQYAKGFENSDLISCAPQIGVRESRMIEGEYTITAEDLLDCREFEDSVACGAYGIDIHNPDGTGTTLKRISGSYYQIPYRALIPKSTSNLLVAGRCISSTHEAQSAYRVMPICCSMGEAAGIAAAIANQQGGDVRKVDIATLQQRIAEYGGRYQ